MPNLMTRVNDRINRMTAELIERQAEDGSWPMCCDSGIMADCYLVILLCSMDLHLREERLIRQLAERISSRQQSDGSWRLFHDNEEGHLETTVEAYYALLFSGRYTGQEPRMTLAKQYILASGGLSKVRTMLTQVILASTGQAKWPKSLQVPLEVFFASHGIGMDIFTISGHARAHLVPVLVLSNNEYSLQSERTPDLADLYRDGRRHTFDNDSKWTGALIDIVDAITSLLPTAYPSALRDAEAYMLARIEPNGTLLTYSTATMLMVLALLSLGYSRDSPFILAALKGVRSLMCSSGSIQVASSTVWDTAMISSALQQAGVPADHPANRKAAQYLLSRQQQKKRGDWVVRSPHTEPGGWGFSDVNTIYPDVDDTAAVLRAIQTYSNLSIHTRMDWQRGLNWMLALHNDDGGWPAFERDNGSFIASLLSFDHAKDIVTDPSTADVTARVLLFLGNQLGLSIRYRWVDHAVNWLLSQQKTDGSWYGRWGIAYVHGTGAVLEGLRAVGVPADHSAIARAVRWLRHAQLEDGGWGESCFSDQRSHYIPLMMSTPSQTAWALDGLLAVGSQPDEAVERGMNALLGHLERPDWMYTYPTGAGLPGSVYSHYESNNYIWPLRTMAKYRTMQQQNDEV